MKTIKLLLAAALLSGVSSLAFAGPSPDWFARAEKERAEARAQAAAAKSPATQQVVACSSCSCCAMKKS